MNLEAKLKEIFGYDNFRNGQKQIILAEEYGVSRPTITRIINETIWKKYEDINIM